MSSRIAIVTATANFDRAASVIKGWMDRAHEPLAIYVVQQGMGTRDWERSGEIDRHVVSVCRERDYLGVVPAFARGVSFALNQGHPIIACLHDDLEIEDPNWDLQVKRIFRACPHAGLVGFGGAFGLGDQDIHQKPYHPMQLARQRFISNMRHAEQHGQRVTMDHRIAVLDGFSQIGLADFWKGLPHANGQVVPVPGTSGANLFGAMARAGVVHHAYDAALGCYAKRLGYQVWYTPVRVHHHGGLTAVADPDYHAWAKRQDAEGDQGFWLKAHEWVYNEFKDELPIRV